MFLFRYEIFANFYHLILFLLKVYYYNLKSSPKIINDVRNRLTFSASENSLIHYQRNSYELNVLDSTKVQHACVVRNIKVLTEASIHTASLDHRIELDSYIRFMSAYFLFITCILITTLVIFMIHFITIKFKKKQNTFLAKLGKELYEEELLTHESIERNDLNKLYVNIDTINQLMNSREFYMFLNPFQVNIINEEYQLMRLKYKRIKDKIEDKILELDGHFQQNRNSIAQLNSDFTDRFPLNIAQRELLANARFNQQLKAFFHPQTKQFNAPINLKNKKNLTEHNLFKKLKFSPKFSIWNNTRRSISDEDNKNANKKFLNKSGQRKRVAIKSDYLFKYSLPNNMDLIVRKYNK